jgi:DNA-binding transcriptional regulator YhcF (GntR family)
MFELDSESQLPRFQQLRNRILHLVQSGDLAVGTRLPTVRGLADDLGIAPNTVAKVYRQLETDGVIVTRGRNGTFVGAQGDAPARSAQAAAAAYADRARQLGIPPEQALRFVEVALARRS